ncbi:7021_t:CDS:2, partial [Funneliformis caledonium]
MGNYKWHPRFLNPPRYRKENSQLNIHLWNIMKARVSTNVEKVYERLRVIVS